MGHFCVTLERSRVTFKARYPQRYGSKVFKNKLEAYYRWFDTRKLHSQSNTNPNSHDERRQRYGMILFHSNRNETCSFGCLATYCTIGSSMSSKRQKQQEYELPMQSFTVNINNENANKELVRDDRVWDVRLGDWMLKCPLDGCLGRMAKNLSCIPNQEATVSRPIRRATETDRAHTTTQKFDGCYDTQVLGKIMILEGFFTTLGAGWTQSWNLCHARQSFDPSVD